MAESGFKSRVLAQGLLWAMLLQRSEDFTLYFLFLASVEKLDDLAALSLLFVMIPKDWRNEGCSPVSAHISITLQCYTCFVILQQRWRESERFLNWKIVQICSSLPQHMSPLALYACDCEFRSRFSNQDLFTK